jgi:8-oxo-dGTP pyrophosphatase MutT (NUDIX family)
MIKEKSAGLIIFRRHPQEGMQYLVLYHRGTYWNFPKGKVESGESEIEAAIRETKEETGLMNLRLVEGFREQTQFFFRELRQGKSELIKKDFAIYLAEVDMKAAPRLSSEHNGYAWLDFKTASKFLKFKNLKEILLEANSLINKK